MFKKEQQMWQYMKFGSVNKNAVKMFHPRFPQRQENM